QRWGPKKVVDYLGREQPEMDWPVDSTAGEILKRAGLVQPRLRRHRVAPYTQPFGECEGPNQSWSADFKGDFRLGNGRRCYPLTLSDNFSRYLLLCRGLERPSHEAVRPWFEWVFREYGLPEAIRTDNGAPFASLAMGGISQLSKWWIRLGIKPERIRPGKPAQNGRHERMHRTLKEAVPAQKTLPAQQRHFDPFREERSEEHTSELQSRSDLVYLISFPTRRSSDLFASLAMGGISQLSKWWIRLGIKPERIRPGKPAQNGRHERMHRTLKEAVPAQKTLPAQQRHFDPFREEYNWQRSHESLGRETPGSVYRS